MIIFALLSIRPAQMRLFAVDAARVSAELGLGGHVNVVLITAFLNVLAAATALPADLLIDALKACGLPALSTMI